MAIVHSRSSGVKVIIVQYVLLFNSSSVTKGDRGAMETDYWVTIINDATVSTVIYFRAVSLPSWKIGH